MDDQRLVQIALAYGFVTAEQVRAAEQEAAALSDRGIDRGVLFILEDLGYLTDGQMRRLRRQTSSAHIRALVVEDFVLRGRVGSGGMGEVFRGERDDGTVVAIKLLPQRMLDVEEYLGRFRREGRILEKLVHPHITGFHSAGVVDGRPFVIMELVEGPSLKALILDHGPQPQADVVLIMRQMAEALQFAWRFGVVHRDIKPSNIILGPARSGKREPFCAKLCDFGLAKTVVRLDDDTASLTRSGMAVGTPHYMCPEVATGSDVLEPGIDIYSLAASAYHALTGETLYSGKSSAVIMYKQATARIDIDRVGVERVSPALRRLLADMLAKDRRHRIGDWDTVLERLRAIEDESGVAAVTLPGVVSRGRAVVRPWAFAHLALLLATVVFFLAAVILLLVRDDDHLEMSTRPDQFQHHLLAAEERLATGRSVSLILDPGVYPGPWTFTRSQSGLRLRARSPGVVVRMPAGDDRPVVTVAAGCRDLRLHGLTLENEGSGPGLQISEGAESVISALVMGGGGADAISVTGGSLRLIGARLEDLRGGILLLPGSRLVASDLLLTSESVLLEARDAVVDLHRSRLHAIGTGTRPTALFVADSTLVMEEVEIAAAACEVGLTLERCGSVKLREVGLRAAPVGLRSFNSDLEVVEGVTIQAKETGIVWTGAWNVAWRWRALRVTAPEPLRGEALRGLPIDGRGVDPQMESRLPPVSTAVERSDR